jgi:hypothetical protein
VRSRGQSRAEGVTGAVFTPAVDDGEPAREPDHQPARPRPERLGQRRRHDGDERGDGQPGVTVRALRQSCAAFGKAASNTFQPAWCMAVSDRGGLPALRA